MVQRYAGTGLGLPAVANKTVRVCLVTKRGHLRHHSKGISLDSDPPPLPLFKGSSKCACGVPRVLMFDSRDGPKVVPPVSPTTPWVGILLWSGQRW